MKRCHELLLVEVGMGGCDFSELRKKNVKCFQRPNKRAIDVSHFSVSPPPLKNTSCYEVVLKILSVNLNLLKQKLISTFQYWRSTWGHLDGNFVGLLSEKSPRVAAKFTEKLFKLSNQIPSAYTVWRHFARTCTQVFFIRKKIRALLWVWLRQINCAIDAWCRGGGVASVHGSSGGWWRQRTKHQSHQRVKHRASSSFFAEFLTLIRVAVEGKTAV